MKVLQQPIENVYIASTGMVSLLDAIGALDAVKLVGSEVSGWYIDGVVERMEDGRIEFGGKYSEPDYEQMTAKGIQLHVDTTMVNNNPEVLEKFDELGISLRSPTLWRPPPPRATPWPGWSGSRSSA